MHRHKNMKDHCKGPFLLGGGEEGILVEVLPASCQNSLESARHLAPKCNTCPRISLSNGKSCVLKFYALSTQLLAACPRSGSAHGNGSAHGLSRTSLNLGALARTSMGFLQRQSSTEINPHHDYSTLTTKFTDSSSLPVPKVTDRPAAASGEADRPTKKPVYATTNAKDANTSAKVYFDIDTLH